MEWAADGKFEDHASFVFLNRRLPVPEFTSTVSNDGHALEINTGSLSLTYTPEPGGRFTSEDLDN